MKLFRFGSVWVGSVWVGSVWSNSDYKAISASQQSWNLGLAELGKKIIISERSNQEWSKLFIAKNSISIFVHIPHIRTKTNRIENFRNKEMKKIKLIKVKTHVQNSISLYKGGTGAGRKE